MCIRDRANSDADKYAAEKEKADGRFKEALDYLEEAATISPENENVKKMLPQVKAVMKQFDQFYK